MMSSSSSNSSRIDIASSAQRVAVDNRISLRIYFRIADNLLRQAFIFRNEKNVIDLYVMLLRFSSLVSETIPQHRDYAASPKSKKSALRKQLLKALDELESLNATVKQKVKEREGKPAFQAIGWNDNTPSSVQWSPSKLHTLTDNQPAKSSLKFPGILHKHEVMSEDERFRRLSLNVPRPKEETLSRHSILGPRGLCGNWQQPRSDKGVWYPTNIDATPVEIPRVQQPVAFEDQLAVKKENNTLDVEIPSLELIHEGNDNHQKPQVCEHPMILFETSDVLDNVIIKQPTPPPALLEVQELIPEKPAVVEKQNVVDSSLLYGLLCPESPMELHISTSMMDTFMKLAKSNTTKNLETCGVLAGSLKNRKFYVTALIIPKQVSTSDSCQTTNEEEIFEVQDKQSLFPLGWIHTHPTQSCFMSSIDVHTHYSYQVMLPEAVAIVMAPRDTNKTHGIFRLTTPGGMSLIRNCQRRGFHAHDPPADGGPIYSNCTDVYMNPKLKFDVIDLRR